MTKKEAQRIAWELYRERQIFDPHSLGLPEFDLAANSVAMVVTECCGRDLNGNRRVTTVQFMDWVRGFDKLDPSKL